MMASASALTPTRAAGVEQAVQLNDGISHRGELGALAAEPAIEQLFSGQLFGHGLILRSSPAADQNEVELVHCEASLRELGLAVAHQLDQRTMAGGTGGNQRAVHDMRSIVAQRPAGKIGH